MPNSHKILNLIPDDRKRWFTSAKTKGKLPMQKSGHEISTGIINAQWPCAAYQSRRFDQRS